MKKSPIGFNLRTKEEKNNAPITSNKLKVKTPKKSVVQVYFPHRGTGWAYYNDSFDLKVGDFVYVEGKLEGYRGYVTEVNYAFKIKLSDYKKVIAVVDTDVKGALYFSDSHIISFDKSAIPLSKIRTWFTAPDGDIEYEIGNDDVQTFSLDDLSTMNILQAAATRGYDYFIENKVVYIEVDRTHGRAIVEGSENYELEFDCIGREISNIKCSCFCSGRCKHEFAAILQLKELLDIITQNYPHEYDDYFAAISKNIFTNVVMNKKTFGKIRLED